jgi:hypothetical protein
MSLSDVENRINSIEGRITDITRRFENMRISMGDGGSVVEENSFKRVLSGKVEEKKRIEKGEKSEKKIPDTIIIPPKNTIDRTKELVNRMQVEAMSKLGNIKENITIQPSNNSPLSFSSKGENIENIILEVAKKYRIDPELIHAIIGTESDYDLKAVSPKGALGLMQLMPETARELGVKNPEDPRENIEGGVKYLRNLIDRFGDIEKALAAYNSGPANVKKYDGIPPFKETEDYIRKVLTKYAELKNGDSFE